MKDLLDQLSSYNIFNYLFPGILFAVIGSHISPFKLTLEDNVQGAFLYYLYGLIISRIGSHIIEPFYKKMKIIKFAPYPQFVAASRIDPQINILSEQNNVFRTLLATVLSVLILYILGMLTTAYPGIKSYSDITLIAIAIIIFSCSYNKQTSYVRNRVNSVNQVSPKQDDPSNI